MSSDLFRMIYCSRPVGGESPDFQSTLAGILAAARRNNERSGITGALMFNPGIFVQVLEGPHARVTSTFERVRNDPRHFDVTLLELEHIASRRFPNWSMGFLGVSRTGQDVFRDFANATGFDKKRLEGEKIFHLIHRIALEEELPVD